MDEFRITVLRNQLESVRTVKMPLQSIILLISGSPMQGLWKWEGVQPSQGTRPVVVHQ